MPQELRRWVEATGETWNKATQRDDESAADSLLQFPGLADCGLRGYLLPNSTVSCAYDRTLPSRIDLNYQDADESGFDDDLAVIRKFASVGVMILAYCQNGMRQSRKKVFLKAQI
jgi:hypothetical protein